LAGCGHDIGKCEVANLLLDSKDLQPAEFEEIKQHAVQGYARLKDDFLFTSLVAGLHHKYRADGYGIDLEEAAPTALSVATKASIAAMAQLVMMADFFDALTTRENNKGLIQDPHDPVQQLAVMSQHFPRNPGRVDWLIENSLGGRLVGERAAASEISV
jgi:response regulator RpfG family c-di-GMP phosphodiesterase